MRANNNLPLRNQSSEFDRSSQLFEYEVSTRTHNVLIIYFFRKLFFLIHILHSEYEMSMNMSIKNQKPDITGVLAFISLAFQANDRGSIPRARLVLVCYSSAF